MRSTRDQGRPLDLHESTARSLYGLQRQPYSTRACQSLSESGRVCESLAESIRVYQSLSQPHTLPQPVRVCDSLRQPVRACHSQGKGLPHQALQSPDSRARVSGSVWHLSGCGKWDPLSTLGKWACAKRSPTVVLATRRAKFSRERLGEMRRGGVRGGQQQETHTQQREENADGAREEHSCVAPPCNS